MSPRPSFSLLQLASRLPFIGKALARIARHRDHRQPEDLPVIAPPEDTATGQPRPDAPAPRKPSGTRTRPQKKPPASPVAPATPKAPACPHCRETMVMKVASSGGNAGGPFWGCSDYPRCRGMRVVRAPLPSKRS